MGGEIREIGFTYQDELFLLLDITPFDMLPIIITYLYADPDWVKSVGSVSRDQLFGEAFPNKKVGFRAEISMTMTG